MFVFCFLGSKVRRRRVDKGVDNRKLYEEGWGKGGGRKIIREK